ncbi:ribbon-helix-helix domain-containing protein [Lichenihabitans psoromatis]|uniref:ribbon-helix-helix domain-containing protein n=1 Tax=Lichenihabitans psoromatis TaxID=2528642 RepID=UPI00103664DD|nr:ribbon-helix-helix domain-containing protein [Lichenihabitans psoromatis]
MRRIGDRLTTPSTIQIVAERRRSPTSVAKHSLVIAGHSTSVSLEDAFWSGLKAIAAGRDMAIAALVAEIDQTRGDANLSSALRVFVLDHYRSR